MQWQWRKPHKGTQRFLDRTLPPSLAGTRARANRGRRCVHGRSPRLQQHKREHTSVPCSHPRIKGQAAGPRRSANEREAFRQIMAENTSFPNLQRRFRARDASRAATRNRSLRNSPRSLQYQKIYAVEHSENSRFETRKPENLLSRPAGTESHRQWAGNNEGFRVCGFAACLPPSPAGGRVNRGRRCVHGRSPRLRHHNANTPPSPVRENVRLSLP